MIYVGRAGPGRAFVGPLLALVAGLAPPLDAAQGRRADPVVQLERWVQQVERSRKEPSPEDLGELARLCADARLLHQAAPERGPEIASALLDVASARPAGPAFSGDQAVRPGSQAALLRSEGRATLADLLRADAELARWAATYVLARSNEPPERRLALARTLEGLHLPPTRLGLFACGMAPDPGLRNAATAALAGWQDDGVHRFLIDQIRRNAAQPGWIAPRAVRAHFGQIQVPPGSPAEKALRGYVREALASEDWRVAYRGLQLAPGLADESVVPDLIAALRSWIERRALGQGRLRLEGDIAHELRRRSGRSIGPHPERWETWWRSRQGAGGKEDADEPLQVTSAGFFGLRPLTDRVVLVLDRSGSMENAFEGGARTRFEEATEQLLQLLESLGPQTRFGLILFSGETYVWSEQLRPATPANLGLVRSWMRGNGTGGATNLEPAILEAMHVDSRGRIDLARLEADTVIVLCDGATAEGPGWVAPLIEGPNEEACLVFHSVQIGTGGDGTLEALAEATGGDSVVVRG